MTELGSDQGEAGPRVRAAEPAARPRAAAKTSERLANVERLRIVAMLEIVTFHVGGALDGGLYRLPIVAGLGLPVFLLLNNAFNCTLSERMGIRGFLQAKLSKLLLPWLVWSGVYAAMIMAEKLRHGEPLGAAFSPWMLMGGTYTHLWFVPFAFFGSVLIAVLQARTRAVAPRWIVAATLVSGAALTVACAWALGHWRGMDWPLPQWVFALPSPLLGFALGRVLLSGERRLGRAVAALLAVLALVIVALTLLGGAPLTLRRYAVSMALVSLFFLWPGRADAFSRRLTPLLFGVYLTHPLLLRLYQAAHLPALSSAVIGSAIFAASALCVEALRHTPLRRLV